MSHVINLNLVAAEAKAFAEFQNRSTAGPWKDGISGGSVVMDEPISDDPQAQKFYGGQLVCESAGVDERQLIIFARSTPLPRLALQLVERVRELEDALEQMNTLDKPCSSPPGGADWLGALERRMARVERHHPGANYFDNQIEKIRQAVSALSDKLCAAEKSQFSSQMRIGKNTESLLELRGRVVDLADRLEDHAHVLPNSDIVDHGVMDSVLNRLDALEKALLSNEKRIGALYRMREEECACEEPRHDILPPLAIDAAKLSPGTRAQAEPFLDNSAVVPTSRDIRGECREWLVTVQKQLSDGGVPDPGTVAAVDCWLATVPDPAEVPMVLRKLRRLMEKEERDGKKE